MSYILQHTVLFWCSLDILVAILLVGFIAYFVVKHQDFKKKQHALKDEISKLENANPAEATENGSK